MILLNLVEMFYIESDLVYYINLATNKKNGILFKQPFQRSFLGSKNHRQTPFFPVYRG